MNEPISQEDRESYEAELLAYDRAIYAQFFFEKVMVAHGKGNASAIRLCLMKSVYASIYHEYCEEAVFKWNDGQWLSQWRNLNRFLPEHARFKTKPSFASFTAGLTLAAKYSNLRLGQLMCWLSETRAPKLFIQESKHFKLGLLAF